MTRASGLRDLQLFEYFDENPPPGDGSIVLAIGPFWWLSAVLALPVGAVWSVITAIANARTSAAAPAMDAPPATHPSEAP